MSTHYTYAECESEGKLKKINKEKSDRPIKQMCMVCFFLHLIEFNAKKTNVNKTVKQWREKRRRRRTRQSKQNSLWQKR